MNEMTERKKYEQLLEESEERYHALAELSPDAVAVQQQGKLIYVNAAARELLGAKDPGKIIGKSVFDFIEPRAGVISREQAGRLEDQGQGLPETIFKVRSFDGCSREVAVVSTPIAYGGKPAAQIIIRDPAARSAAEKAMRFQAEVLSQVTDAVVVADNEQRIIYWNKGAERLYHYSTAEVLGRRLEEINRYCWNDPGQETSACSALNKNGFWRCEGVHFTKDGKKLHVASSVSVLKDESGYSCGMVAVTHDITERTDLEKELRESEKEFRSMFEQAAVGKAQTDPETGRFVRVNKKFCDITGYSPAELIGMTYVQLTDPEDRNGEIDPHQPAPAQTAPGWTSVKRYVRKDGKIIWVKVTGTVIFDSEGKSIRSIADIEDITESRQAEQTLQESEERYRSLVECSPEAICVQQGALCMYMNPAGLELLGAENFEDLKEKKMDDFIHPDFHKRAADWLRHVAEKGAQAPSLELKMMRLNGQEVNVEAVASPITFAGKPATQIIINDISQRKHTELRLRLQATVLSQVNDAVVAVGKDRRIIFWNAGAERLYKMPAEDAIGRRREEVYLYRWITPVDEIAAKESMATTGFLRGENIHILKSGEQIYVESSVSVLTDWANAPAGWIAVMRDVTERKMFERKLQESEERYRSLVESSPDSILVHQGGKLIYVNPATLKLLGARTPSEIIGKDILDFVHPDLMSRTEERFDYVEEEGLPLPARESNVIRLDGGVVHIEAVGTHIAFGGKPATQIIAKDITERKKFEEALRNSEQLYRLMFESNPHPMWIYDTDTLRFLFVNDAAVARYGYSKEEFLSMAIKDIRLAEGASTLFDNVAKIATGLYDAGNWRHKKKDGTVIDVEIISHSLKIAGKDARVILAHDITDRKKAEAALRESQQAYRTLAENLPGIVYRVFSRENNRIQFFNKTATAMTGYRDDELEHGVVCSLERLIVVEDRAVVIGEVKRAVEEKRPFTVEYRLKHKNGETRFMLEQGAPIYGNDGKLLYIDGVISDVTEQKEAERALRESEERQRAVFDHSPMAIIVKDLKGRHTIFNRQAEKWMNTRREDVLGKTVYDFLPKNEADQCTIGDQKVIDARAPLQTEEIMVLPDGIHTHLTVKFPLFDAAGSLYAVCCIMSDITEMQRAEQALRESEERQRAVFDNSPIAIFAKDLEGRFILFNRQAELWLGKSENEVLGKTDYELFPREMAEKLRAHDCSVIESGTPIETEEQVTYGGKEHIHLDMKFPLVDSKGKIYAVCGISSDITERKRAEQAVKEARDSALFERNRLETVLNTIPSAVFVEGKDIGVILQNKLLQEMTGSHIEPGSSAAEWIRKLRLHKPDGSPFSPEELPSMRALRSGFIIRDVEVILERSDGNQVTVLANAAPLRDAEGNIIAAVTAFSDITERKRAEQAIKEARDAALRERSKLEIILNTIPSGVFVAEGPDGAITLQNEQTLQIMGRNIDNPITAADRIIKYEMTNAVGNLFKPEELPYLRALLDGEQVRDVEMTFRRPDGRKLTVLANAAPLRDGKGNIIASVSAFNDISERKEAEDALKRARIELELRVRERTAELAATVAALQSEIAERKRTAAERDKLVAAVESTAEAIVVTDNRGIIQYMNPSFERITGYEKHEVLGKDLHFLDSGQHDEDFFPRMRETIRLSGVWKGRLINKKKDGSIYYEDCTYSPVRDRSGNIVNYVSIKHDVTERLRLESIAETVDAMNNIGYVFSGIRHEIGNPVSSLLIILSLLKKKYDTNTKDPIREYVDQAIGQVERIEYLLKSLKNFNMYENLQIRSVELSSFLEKFIPLVTADFSKKGIEFQVEEVPEECWMSVDPRALQQALVNVVVNASDAVAERPDPKIIMSSSKVRGMVLIRVVDNGTGIPEDRKKDLFKPFYTTKSNGTGLGLVITRKLVSRMKGFIEIESRNDQGTTVDIYLPEGTVERNV